MKVLILGTNQGKRYNFGHELFKREIARQSNARFYGKGYKFWQQGRVDIHSIMRILGFRPDVIVSYMGKYCKWVEGLKDVTIPKVHIVIDYFPWNYAVEDDFIHKHKVDLVLPVYSHEVRELRCRGFNARQLPFGVDTEVFHCSKQRRDMEVMAVFSVVSWAYPTRNRILEELKSHGFHGLIRASWPQSRLQCRDYVNAVCRSKIVVNGVDTCRSLNWKFFEACAGGAMLLTERAEDMERLGFIDGVNCVIFEGMKQMLEKIQYYLSRDDLRSQIAKRGQELVRQQHSLVKRIQDFSGILEEEFGL